MKFVLLIIHLFVLCACHKDHEKIRKQTLVNEVRKKVAEKLSKDFNLIPCGTGAQMMDQVKMIALAFDCRRIMDIKSARKLLVNSVVEFAQMVNEDERIRPYLNNYPFEPRNIEIRIFLQGSERGDLENNELCVISIIDEVLRYTIRDAVTDRLKIAFEESYDEAVQKISLRQKSA